jgi:hypothetical protein
MEELGTFLAELWHAVVKVWYWMGDVDRAAAFALIIISIVTLVLLRGRFFKVIIGAFAITLLVRAIW